MVTHLLWSLLNLYSKQFWRRRYGTTAKHGRCIYIQFLWWGHCMLPQTLELRQWLTKERLQRPSGCQQVSKSKTITGIYMFKVLFWFWMNCGRMELFIVAEIHSSSQQSLPSLEFARCNWKLQRKTVFSLINLKVISQSVFPLSSSPRNQKATLILSSLFSSEKVFALPLKEDFWGLLYQFLRKWVLKKNIKFFKCSQRKQEFKRQLAQGSNVFDLINQHLLFT